jgi:hypothetical protein
MDTNEKGRVQTPWISTEEEERNISITKKKWNV